MPSRIFWMMSDSVATWALGRNAILTLPPETRSNSAARRRRPRSQGLFIGALVAILSVMVGATGWVLACALPWALAWATSIAQGIRIDARMARDAP